MAKVLWYLCYHEQNHKPILFIIMKRKMGLYNDHKIYFTLHSYTILKAHTMS